MGQTNPLLTDHDAYTAYQCRGCGAVLGACTATVLVLGGARLRRPVTTECQCCGRRREWAPERVTVREDFPGEYAQ